MMTSAASEWEILALGGGRSVVSSWASEHLGNCTCARASISSLTLGHTPREVETYRHHVRALADVETILPPILVHKPTGRVIDGAHRVRAAVLRGDSSIDARMFSGSLDDAFVLAVRLNSQHGLPLSRQERRSATIKILLSHPQWSDRVIAEITGLSRSTIGNLRRQPSVGARASSVARIGKDGKVRPLDSSANALRVRELLAQHPAASMRTIAKEAGVSAATVLNIRRRTPPVRDGETSKCAAQGGIKSFKDKGEVQPLGEGAERASAADIDIVLNVLLKDPSIRLSAKGRFLLRWLSITREGVGLNRQIVDSVPDHCAAAVAKMARYYALAWTDLAIRLER